MVKNWGGANQKSTFNALLWGNRYGVIMASLLISGSGINGVVFHNYWCDSNHGFCTRIPENSESRVPASRKEDTNFYP